MSAGPISQLDALAPVRAALLERARADAARTLARAQRDADALLEGARAEADALLDAARSRGAEEAAAVLAAERSRTRRTTLTAELEVRREAYDELRERTAARLRERCAGPDGRVLTARMAERVRAALGPDAVIVPAPGGGVRGHVAGRFADCSVDALAERAVEALGPEVEALWADR
jgi:vacuolar-type H+-ATPase subunit E/Vma4